MSDNPFIEADRIARKRVSEAQAFIATVVGTSGGLISFRRAGSQTTEWGEAAATGLAATLSGGELVLVIPAGSTHVVLQEVVTS